MPAVPSISIVLAIPTLASPSELEVERRMLAPWRAACARFLGSAPRHLRDDRGPLLKFHSDDSPGHAAAIAKVRVFGGHAPVRAHLRALGYDWDDAGFLATIPTPLTFVARVRGLGFEPAYVPELHTITGIYMSKHTWVARQCAGALPVTVGTAGFYRRARVRQLLSRVTPGGARWREHLRYHLHGVQHDMTKHALCLHLVPRAQVQAIGERAMEAWQRHPHRVPPEPLARFFENDLTAYCQAIWRDLPDPAAFAPTFDAPRNLAQLYAALDATIAEHARGPLHWLIAKPPAPPNFSIDRPTRRG